jgi:hypothetical protein
VHRYTKKILLQLTSLISFSPNIIHDVSANP